MSWKTLSLSVWNAASPAAVWVTGRLVYSWLSLVCWPLLVMNLTNFSAPSWFCVLLNIERFIPAVWDMIGSPPGGSGSGTGMGAIPYSLSFIPLLASAVIVPVWNMIMAAFSFAKSVGAWVPVLYCAPSGEAILSFAMKSTYCLTARTICGESKVGLFFLSKSVPPCCLPRMKAQCEFSVTLAPSTASPHLFGGFVSFLATARNSSQVFGGLFILASWNIALL